MDRQESQTPQVWGYPAIMRTDVVETAYHWQLPFQTTKFRDKINRGREIKTSTASTSRTEYSLEIMSDPTVVAQLPQQQGTAGLPSDIWSSMLKSVGGVNTTPSGTLLLLGRQNDLFSGFQFSNICFGVGGSKETQVDLIKQLQNTSVFNPTSQGFTATAPPKSPEIANSFSLGYTYVEFKEYDHDGMFLVTAVRLALTKSFRSSISFGYLHTFVPSTRIKLFDIIRFHGQANEKDVHKAIISSYCY